MAESRKEVLYEARARADWARHEVRERKRELDALERERGTGLFLYMHGILLLYKLYFRTVVRVYCGWLTLLSLQLRTRRSTGTISS